MLSLPLFNFLLDEVDHVCFETHVVECVDPLHPGGAGDIHFGEVVADDVEPDEVESFLPETWANFTADLVIPGSSAKLDVILSSGFRLSEERESDRCATGSLLPVRDCALLIGRNV